jgi:hypothetical protein
MHKTMLAAAAFAAAIFGTTAFAEPPKQLAQAACDPTIKGKYSGLLKRFAVPSDRKTYGDCKDYGKSSFTSWKGNTNLPNGYWTYAAPNWYIWSTQR